MGVRDPLTNTFGRERIWDYGLALMGLSIVAQLVLHGVAAYGIGWEPQWMPYNSTAYHLFWSAYYCIPTGVMVYLLWVAPPLHGEEK